MIYDDLKGPIAISSGTACDLTTTTSGMSTTSICDELNIPTTYAIGGGLILLSSSIESSIDEPDKVIKLSDAIIDKIFTSNVNSYSSIEGKANRIYKRLSNNKNDVLNTMIIENKEAAEIFDEILKLQSRDSLLQNLEVLKKIIEEKSINKVSEEKHKIQVK